MGRIEVEIEAQQAATPKGAQRSMQQTLRKALEKSGIPVPKLDKVRVDHMLRKGCPVHRR
jgi:hypothetical protein